MLGMDGMLGTLRRIREWRDWIELEGEERRRCGWAFVMESEWKGKGRMWITMAVMEKAFSRATKLMEGIWIHG